MYMEERLGACLGRFNDLSISDLVQGVLDDIEAFTDEAAQADDITVMALKYR